ncbi:hypothetical protein OTU49_006960, partial [Cherax quadricarinatus]
MHYRGMLVAQRFVCGAYPMRFLATVAQEASAKTIEGPLSVYDNFIAERKLLYDQHQKEIVNELQRCYDEVLTYTPPPPPNALQKFLGWQRDVNPPRGVYIWGTVGTGKTRMMDLMFECLPGNRKRRAVMAQSVK